jgi:hypothetical protein
MRAMKFSHTLGMHIQFLTYIMMLVAVWYAFTALFRKDFVPQNQSESIYLDAFRAGSAIYIGTFILSNNYDYRLMFLILTIPQLIIWSRYSSLCISISSIVTLLSIFLSQWYLVILEINTHLRGNCIASYVIDGISKWIAFSSLLYLLCWSLPGWAKALSRNMICLTTTNTTDENQNVLREDRQHRT